MGKELNDKYVSIIILTKNKVRTLSKTLLHYSNNRFKGRVIIGSIGTKKSFQAIQKFCGSMPFKTTVVQLDPTNNLHAGQAIFNLHPRIQTPFVVYSKDDDIFMIKGIQDCIDYLKHNRDYTAAGGLSVTHLQCGNFSGSLYSSCLDLTSNYQPDRLRDYFRSKSSITQYVYRTSTWNKMFQFSHMIPDKWIGSEILPSCISVLSGKIKDISRKNTVAVTVVKQEKDSLWDDKINFVDIITSPDYAISFQLLKTIILKYLRKAGLNEDEAIQFYRTEIWTFLLTTLLHKFVEQFPSMYDSLELYLKQLNNYPFHLKRDSLPSTIIDSNKFTYMLKERT